MEQKFTNRPNLGQEIELRCSTCGQAMGRSVRDAATNTDVPLLGAVRYVVCPSCNQVIPDALRTAKYKAAWTRASRLQNADGTRSTLRESRSSRGFSKSSDFGRIVVNANDSWAVAQDLSRHTIAFVDLNTPATRITSGVLVNIADHLFVATAAAAVPARTEYPLSYGVPNTQTSDSGVLPIVRCGRNDSDGPGVAFLELDPIASLPVSSKEAIGLDQIRLCGAGYPEWRCFLFGNIAEMMCHGQENASSVCPRCRPICYSKAPKLSNNWPSISPPKSKTNPMVDIFLPYDPVEEMWHGDEDYSRDAGVDPSGSVGGGLWHCTRTTDERLAVKEPCLFGIHTEWNNEEKYARGCQIIHWLRLLHRHYQDLRSTLTSAFPELA